MIPPRRDLMGVLSKCRRKDLEYHIVQLMFELYQAHAKQLDGESFRFVDILDDLETEKCYLLKDLAREIWREEDYEPEEWAELRRKLGL